MRTTTLLAVMAVLALCACQQPPTFQVEQSRSYALSKDTAWSNLLAFLHANDITVVKSDPAAGVIEARRTRYQDAGWAYCEPAVVTSHFGNSRRPRRTRIQLDRDLALQIGVREIGDRVQVAPHAQFSERQINPYKNLPFSVRCQSTGALEKSLLDAV